MATEAITAWFLHKRPSGDTSLRVSFLTREHGIVEALYKGGRTPKKQAIIQAFTPLWLALDVRHDWYYVRKLECDSPPLLLTGDALYAGLYVNEILYSMFKPHDSDPQLFSAYADTLQSLSTASGRLTIEPILRRFEQILLRASGYALSLTHEAESGQPINVSQSYQFLPGSGLVPVCDGYRGEYILAFSKNRFDDLNTLRTAKAIMRQAIAHAMEGKSIQSRALYCS